MKLLCEVPASEVKTFRESNFSWLAKSNSDNLLFTFENQKQMRVFAIKNTNGLHNNNKEAQSRAREAQSAALAEPRLCTSSSWNRDESLLALVVDRRQIYFWEVHRNTFVQFKPKYLMQEQQFVPANELSVSGRRRGLGKYVDHIAWSKSSDKLAICLSDAQILLCKVVTDPERAYVSSGERLIANSEGLLKQINSIHVSQHADLFVCSSVGNELLVMTFDGANLLYCQGQGEGHIIYNMKFSPLIREYDSLLAAYCEDKLWLAYQDDSDGSLFLRKISLADTSSQAQEDISCLKLAVLLEDSDRPDGGLASSLVDFHWLNSARLIACLSHGSIQLLSINDTSQSVIALSQPGSLPVSINVTKSEVLRLDLRDDGGQIRAEVGPVKAFQLAQNVRQLEDSHYRRCFAFAALTSYRLYHYEIYQCRESTVEGEEEFVFEQLDDLDLSEALAKVKLQFERLKWSQDCSMLALQLASGHLLIYQTQQLHDHLVASHRAKTAYLSAPNEITLLNYARDDVNKLASDEVEASITGGRNSSSCSRSGTPTDGNAIILPLPFRPSLLAIGPQHLAVALNNRVRFYNIESILRANNRTNGQRSGGKKGHEEFAEQEYVTLVIGIGLSARFVATMLDDGRLRLHSLNLLGEEAQSGSPGASVRSNQSTGSNDELSDDGLIDDERFFPDPADTTHRITAFTLTEELLVYCTADWHLYVFSLKHWQTVQTYDHCSSFKSPVHKLKPNDRGNKFICLSELTGQEANLELISSREARETSSNAYLYDLFSNKMFPLDCSGDPLANQMCQRLISNLNNRLPRRLIDSRDVMDGCSEKSTCTPALRNVRDVIWDTDGRSLIFIETSSIHVLAILEHTLEQEEPMAVYVASVKKPASARSTLHLSEGIVSQQTSLGRIINSILETHDDELKLTRLEHKIKTINGQYATTTSGELAPSEGRLLEAQLKVTLLKLEYVCSILPIYSLLKCRDICEHLMGEQTFRFGAESRERRQASESCMELVEQLIWRQLAGWAIFTLNLNFAHQIFQRHGLNEEAAQLDSLFESMKATGLNSRSAISERLHDLLERL